MDTSEKVLLLGGLLSLSYGFLLGLPLASARMVAPSASRHLVTAHLAAIIQGAMLLALTRAAAVSTLPQAAETAGAALLVTGCTLFAGGAIINWRQQIDDHFAVRSMGWRMLAASGPLNIGGLSVFIVGTVMAL